MLTYEEYQQQIADKYKDLLTPSERAEAKAYMLATIEGLKGDLNDEEVDWAKIYKDNPLTTTNGENLQAEIADLTVAYKCDIEDCIETDLKMIELLGL